MSSVIAEILNSVEFLKRAPERARDLALEGGLVSPEHTNRDIMEMFDADPSLTGVAVVENGRPLGLIHRNAFNSRFAKPWSRELYLKTPCTDSMNPDAMRVEADTTTAELGQIVAGRGEEALAEGFIVTEQGRYAGMCSGITLLRALSELQHEQHRSLLSSIDYAAAIQFALMTGSRHTLAAVFPGEDHGLVWRPRDVVGGDCFFASQLGEGVLVGLVDCTGHGVPGALLTMIAVSEIGRLAADPKLHERPGALLSALNQRVKTALQQHEAGPVVTGRSDDGMDAAFVWIDSRRPRLRAASAKLPVMLLNAEGECETIKGDRKGLGYRDTSGDFAWTEYEVELTGPTRLFLATDGVSDQIGEQRQIAFGWSKAREALKAGAGFTAKRQIGVLWSAFEAYRGREARRDDVTILGLELDLAGAGA